MGCFTVQTEELHITCNLTKKKGLSRGRTERELLLFCVLVI